MRRSRACRVDANQAEIVEALRKIPDCTVRSSARVGDGFPDLIVGYCGHNFLFEVKVDDSARLKPLQRKFRDEWRGEVFTVTGVRQIIEIITATRRQYDEARQRTGDS